MIAIQNENNYLIDSSLLAKASAAVFAHQHVTADSELSLALVDETAMQTYNREYRGVDTPTDVLSFPSDEIDPDSNAPYLGDLIISYPTAHTQAEKAGHSVNDELALLTVHGILHLLGHDHFDPAEKESMWAAQAEILSSLGIQAVPTE
jgi:probable rRNA maturation factor